MLKADCRLVRRFMHAFADDELDAVMSLQIQDHFENCPECRGYLGWQRELDDSLDRLREKTPGAGAGLRGGVAAIPGGGVGAAVARGIRNPFIWSSAAVFMILLVSVFVLFPTAGHSGWDVRSFVQTHQLPVSGLAETTVETADPVLAAEWLRERVPGVAVPLTVPEGYRLAGAGIVSIDGKRNGALFYENDFARISCFVFPEGRVSRGFEQVVVRADGIRSGFCERYQVVALNGRSGGLVLVGGLAEESLLPFAEISRAGFD